MKVIQFVPVAIKIMEAANKGAFYGNGLSIGLNIKLPREQHPNPFQNIQLHFNEFLMRKKIFMQYSSAFVVMSYGYWYTG